MRPHGAHFAEKTKFEIYPLKSEKITWRFVMKSKHSVRLLCVGLISLFIFGVCIDASAQGHGRGGGGGRPSGNPGMGSRGAGGVDGGLGTASDRSNGRSDKGLGTASDKSGGRSDDGLARARAANENAKQADKELRDHPGMANGMNMSANQLRGGYQAALAKNPDLKFGQYVAANRIAKNLGRRNPNITTDAILQGLASGKSIGQTLQGLGLNSKEAKDAEKMADQEIKESKRQK
jgi:hypothetical protein